MDLRMSTRRDSRSRLSRHLSSEVRINLAEAQRRFDADHYGLSNAKRSIIEFLAVQALSDRPPPQVLCLAGPPGCGKTSLGRAIANATNREYGLLSVGGTRDELQLLGCKPIADQD